MTHIKCKFDRPYCLMAHPVRYEGEFCGQGCNCSHIQGKDICKYLRFQHCEVEKNVDDYEFYDNPEADAGLILDGKLIPVDLIDYLEIDNRVLIDFRN